MKKKSKDIVAEDATEEKKNTNFRVEPSRKAAYKKAATKSRKSLSEWMRVTLDAAAEALGIEID